MKKILLLVIGLTIISCSSDDDDVTIDPLIGVWESEYGGGSETLSVNSNGTFVFLYEYDDYVNEDDETERGEWSNSGSDFTSFSQTYALSFDEYPDDDDVEITPIFSEDFNSWTYDGDTYTRTIIVKN
jgi:hypothetical protein|tara:strand:- start:88 stop:471 length:384 start_codon:yes stop_codon:yes gene_type:complete